MRYCICLLLSLSCLPLYSKAQSVSKPSINSQIKLTYDTQKASLWQNYLQNTLKPKQDSAISLARRLNIPLQFFSSDSSLCTFYGFGHNNYPLYNCTENLNGAKTISTNKVWNNNQKQLFLEGQGVTIGLWDAGGVEKTHKEFASGQVKEGIHETTPGLTADDHATNVCGTLVANGIKDSSYHGMALKAEISYYNANDHFLEMSNEVTQENLLLSNHSFGQNNQGWQDLDNNPNDNIHDWKWWGDLIKSDKEEFDNPPNGEKTNENFMSFCDKMKENFSNSNLSEKEAENIYNFLVIN